jgi:pyruvate dehydrogenase E1 component beta subunit
MKPIIVHPRMDFMLYAMDAIVNQAAKWSHMTGGQANPGLTIRAIINRGGEQGAQHSQSLHAWFAHVPGLRVVMPATVADARDLLIAAVLSPDPVMFIDDRWLYDQEDELSPIVEQNLAEIGPQILVPGEDITLVACGYTTQLALQATQHMKTESIAAEVIDLRILNPFDPGLIAESVMRTGRLLVVDGGWSTCGMAGEVIASVVERVPVGALKKAPARISLPSAPAPTSRVLERAYYPTVDMIVAKGKKLLG